MPQFRITSLGIAAALACLFAPSSAANAATPLTALRYASDITIALGATTVTPANVAADNLAGAVSLVNVGAIPPDAHVDAYQLLANGDQLLSFDTTVSLPGDVVAGPADVVRFDGATYTIEFDAAANGIPEGVNTDAVAISDGDLLLSFDISVQLGGNSFEDEDIVRFRSGQFMPFFTGATAGVPSDLDLDGAQVIGANRILVSFDGSGTVGGVSFNANDVLEYDSDTGTWEVVYSGSAQFDGWENGNLVALYGLVAAPTPTPTLEITATPTPTSTSLPPPTPTDTPVIATPTPTSTSLAPPTPTNTPVSATPTMTPMTGCVGDCNGDGEVTVDELLKMVNIGLEILPVSDCPAGDANGNGTITINEILIGVNHALSGC